VDPFFAWPRDLRGPDEVDKNQDASSAVNRRKKYEIN
jgi:hypothetical protein